MPNTKCKICRKEFYVKPSHRLRGWGKYCSIECRTHAQRKGKTVECYMCGKHTYRAAKELTRSKSGKFFCGKACQARWRNSVLYIGENHANWTGGEASYRERMRRRRDIKQACKLCGTEDKRILAVHHIDHNRKNNGLDNLMWLCHNCHFLIHHYDSERRKIMVPVA